MAEQLNLTSVREAKLLKDVFTLKLFFFYLLQILTTVILYRRTTRKKNNNSKTMQKLNIKNNKGSCSHMYSLLICIST